MKGFSNRWTDFPDYILGITKEIWEDRGIATLHHYYAPDLVVRSPSSVVVGNQNVNSATLTTLARGQASGRRTASERTVFKSVGTALEDLAAAIQVYESP